MSVGAVSQQRPKYPQSATKNAITLRKGEKNPRKHTHAHLFPHSLDLNSVVCDPDRTRVDIHSLDPNKINNIASVHHPPCHRHQRTRLGPRTASKAAKTNNGGPKEKGNQRQLFGGVLQGEHKRAALGFQQLQLLLECILERKK